MSYCSSGTRILVIGFTSRTGASVVRFALERGCHVTVSDRKPMEELREIMKTINGDVRLIAGEQTPSLLDEGFDLAVLSPGVPVAIPLVQEALRRGIPVISEIELAWREMKGHLIAITGTDGKSTTTALTGHLLEQCGIHSVVAGNIGIPFVEVVGSTRDDSVTVLELSSYQLETTRTLKPDVSVILNLSPDHMDRYDSLDSYMLAKMRITASQDTEDLCVYYKDDDRVRHHCNEIDVRRKKFSRFDETSDAFMKDGILYIDGAPFCASDDIALPGIHNRLNGMAALLAIKEILKKTGRSVDDATLRKALTSFRGLPHRMEDIGVYMGRRFLNDSKATTVGALEMALASLDTDAVLILGGRTKGDDYGRILPMLSKVRGLILLGESRYEFSELFSEFPHRLAATMEEAVKEAVDMSQPGDTILLSPACASFDMYANFEERGNHFRQVVEALEEED